MNVPGDHLGNHILTQKMITAGNWIKSDSDDDQGILIDGLGRVGINKIPSAQLDVSGSINFSGELLQNGQPFETSKWISNGTDICFNGGNVGIGTAPSTSYNLDVAGKIRATEVQIEHLDKWYDCVFEQDYPLKSLDEVKSFVDHNGHLPEVPSEAEVMKNGIIIGEMNSILLKKLEELTLYTIRQQQEIDALKKVLEDK